VIAEATVDVAQTIVNPVSAFAASVAFGRCGATLTGGASCAVVATCAALDLMTVASVASFTTAVVSTRTDEWASSTVEVSSQTSNF
jgi:hypothetical protein